MCLWFPGEFGLCAVELFETDRASYSEELEGKEESKGLLE